jgi:hypothetical protein
MEERIAPTTYMCFNMLIDHTQRMTADLYSRIDDMNSSDARAILAQTPYDFNGGEICMSVGTLHTTCGSIDTQRACGSMDTQGGSMI